MSRRDEVCVAHLDDIIAAMGGARCSCSYKSEMFCTSALRAV
jgi:hypothetical protein